MANVNFHKVSALPVTPVANSIYLVKNGTDVAEIYVTDNSGVAHRGGNTSRTNELIAEALAVLNRVEVVPDIAARNALVGNDRNQLVFVIDASADVTVGSGSALYVFKNSDDTWYKIAEYADVPLSLAWTNITGGPSSSPAQIDAAVTASHSHTNKPVLDALTDNGGILEYSGNPIGVADLDVARDGTSVTVVSQTGTDAILPSATVTLAGVMTAADKSKLDGIAPGADVNVPTNLTLTQTSNDVTIVSDTGTDATIPAATTTNAGVLSAADKTKLDALEVTTGSGVTLIPPQGRIMAGTVTNSFGAEGRVANTTVTTLSYVPASGNMVPIYDGATYTMKTFVAQTYNVPAALAAASVRDVYLVWNGTAVVMAFGVAWGGLNSRGAAADVAPPDNTFAFYSNNAAQTMLLSGGTTISVGARQATYIGTVYCETSGTIHNFSRSNVASGQILAITGFWNLYNQRTRTIQMAGQFTTVTQANGGANLLGGTNRMRFVCGFETDVQIYGMVHARAGSATVGARLVVEFSNGNTNLSNSTFGGLANTACAGWATSYDNVNTKTLTAMGNNQNSSNPGVYTANFLGGNTDPNNTTALASFFSAINNSAQAANSFPSMFGIRYAC